MRTLLAVADLVAAEEVDVAEEVAADPVAAG